MFGGFPSDFFIFGNKIPMYILYYILHNIAIMYYFYLVRILYVIFINNAKIVISIKVYYKEKAVLVINTNTAFVLVKR